MNEGTRLINNWKDGTDELVEAIVKSLNDDAMNWTIKQAGPFIEYTLVTPNKRHSYTITRQPSHDTEKVTILGFEWANKEQKEALGNAIKTHTTYKKELALARDKANACKVFL